MHQVQGVHAQVATGPVHPLPEVVGGVVLRHLVHPAAHLGGHGEAGVGVIGEELPDHLLAAPIAVHIGGVIESDSVECCRLKDRPCIRAGDVPPVAAELPGAQAHHRNLASSVAERALLHGPSFR